MKTLIKIWKIALMITLMVTSVTIFAQTERGTVFTEDWEGNWLTDWHVDAGTWEVGTPTSGPDSAYNGQNCAATVLAGNYPSYADTRLIRHTSFIVPSADQNPRLRFWHWYSLTDDAGRVQIKVGAGGWQTISETYNNTGGGIWTYTSIDLSQFSDSTVQIAFYLKSGYSSNSSGWYIDDVALITGPVVFNNPETWEMGLGDWYADRGTWEVGEPSSGPDTAYAGQNCAATILNGSYHSYVNSRLISPLITIPSANQNPRLRFWHWYSLTDDAGRVQIKVGAGEWQTISETYNNTGGGIWTYPSIDLSQFSDSTVRIAFYLKSGYSSNTSGWYIDDVELITGAVVFNNPETWEMGLGDWYADRGTWEVGEPSSGPDTAYAGQNCAATILNGSYHSYVSSRLISPSFVLPGVSENPNLTFWHWYSLTDDAGRVQIKVGTGEWQTILGPYSNTSGGIWSPVFVDLTPYADSTVQIAFYLKSGYSSNSSGWYIDEVKISPDMVGFEAYENNNIPLQVQLVQNFPNPFSQNTKIQYSILKDENVQLSIYNINGELVEIIVNERQKRGNYSVTWQGRNEHNKRVSPGIYFYELKTGKKLIRKKMLLLK